MTETRKLNPLITLAAISVTVFSLVGIAAITGLLPSSFSRSDESALNKPASPAARASVPATVSTSAKNTGSGAALPATKSASTSSATRKAAPLPVPAAAWS